MRARFRSWWQKIRQRRVAIAITTAIIAIAIVLIIIGYSLDWAGFNEYTQVTTIRTLGGPTAGTVTRTEAYQPGKIALTALWFNRTERKNEQTLSSDNQQEAALQSYLDRMSELLLEKKLRGSDPNAEVRNVARVRTLSMLYQLNTRRINYMLAFLRESELITNDPNTSIVSLRKADLRQVDLHDVDLHGLDLSETIFEEANLSGATITGANFNHTFFGGANLSGANFSLAKFMGDELRAKLGKVDLSKTYLKYATIDKTSLDEIFVTKQQIETMNIIDS